MWKAFPVKNNCISIKITDGSIRWLRVYRIPIIFVCRWIQMNFDSIRHIVESGHKGDRIWRPVQLYTLIQISWNFIDPFASSIYYVSNVRCSSSSKSSKCGVQFAGCSQPLCTHSRTHNLKQSIYLLVIWPQHTHVMQQSEQTHKAQIITVCHCGAARAQPARKSALVGNKL